MTDFHRYRGREQDYWKEHHDRYGSSIIAVGRGNTSVTHNQQEYARARRQFADMVGRDFPGDRSRFRVIDFGFGHGHYARACSELGFSSYRGLDFASKVHPDLGPGYVFEQSDITAPRTPEDPYHLVLCIDTIFHVVEQSKFEVALQNLISHAAPQSRIYITGLFSDRSIEPYVQHRPVEAFAPLKLLSIQAWRDTKIGRFKLP